MLSLMMVLFAVLVVAGAVLYFIDQQLAGWIVAVFASGLAGALVGELFNRERRDHEATDSGGDADLGTDRAGTDPPRSGQELPGAGGSGPGTGGDVERRSSGGTLHGGRTTHWRIYAGLVFGWRRK